MIDIDTHKIVDMIETRELDDVSEWLKSFPNLEVVSRDGSLTYKNAIAQSHPNVIQVSDRFHILKNLTTYCKDFLKKHLKSRVVVDEVIQEKSNENPTLKHHKNYTLKEKFTLVIEAIQTDINVSKACKKYHLDTRVFRKLNAFSDEERKDYFSSICEKTEVGRMTSKMELVTEVIASYHKIKSMNKVANLYDISRKTVKKYLDPNFSPIHGSKGVKKKSILDPFKRIIDDYIKIGATSKEIEEVIRKKGYKGSSSSIRNYRVYRKKEIYESNSEKMTTKLEYVEKQKLMKLLFKKLDKVNGLTEEIVEKVYNRDPIFKRIIKLVESFRHILKNKKIDKFNDWIYTARELKIDEINSFVNGLLRDVEAVKNAIIYEYNNGLAEGKVNKIKVTKRIMYGRCSFDLLKKKSLNLEI